MSAASADLAAYLAAGCAADHFLKPFAALATQEINIEIPPIEGFAIIAAFALNASPYTGFPARIFLVHSATSR
jgi:hypothetical protein